MFFDCVWPSAGSIPPPPRMFARRVCSQACRVLPFARDPPADLSLCAISGTGKPVKVLSIAFGCGGPPLSFKVVSLSIALEENRPIAAAADVLLALVVKPGFSGLEWVLRLWLWLWMGVGRVVHAGERT